MISRTNVADSGSNSRPASTWKPPTGIQVNRSGRPSARPARAARAKATSAETKAAPTVPQARQVAPAVGAPAAEQQHGGAGERQRDQQPGDSAGGRREPALDGAAPRRAARHGRLVSARAGRRRRPDGGRARRCSALSTSAGWRRRPRPTGGCGRCDMMIASPTTTSAAATTMTKNAMTWPSRVPLDAGEGDQGQVHRVEHQLDAHEDDDRVAAHEHARRRRW